ncbi:PREDICTED: probable alkaline/neutral invertase F isoform X2 [Tarenaya hassleriana]|nr:PREDICTED: probable alkaline/neutral invertase F isoform X2 [Tarenaya hassleriana]
MDIMESPSPAIDDGGKEMMPEVLDKELPIRSENGSHPRDLSSGDEELVIYEVSVAASAGDCKLVAADEQSIDPSEKPSEFIVYENSEFDQEFLELQGHARPLCSDKYCELLAPSFPGENVEKSEMISPSLDEIWNNVHRSKTEEPKQGEISPAAATAKEKKAASVPVSERNKNTVEIGKPSSTLKTHASVGISTEYLNNDGSNIVTNVSPAIRGITGPSSEMMEEAWDRLRKSFVYFKGKPVGTLAAMDPSAEALNYNQVFVRDFFPSGLACLMRDPPETEIVKNFLLKTLHLQGWEKRIDKFTLGEGVMPASFKVLYDSHRQKETLVADFGGSAIGRVAPVDSGFWWIILLRTYTKVTHDHTLEELPEVQRGIKLILDLCLSDGFDTFPTLLCADGCSMIDRRMGIYGYPIEIQALFYFSLRCARQMINPERDAKELIERIDKRISALSYHIQEYYWLDFAQLNHIYRYKTEEYSHTAVNKFNVIPESIPDWLFEFMPSKGGYLIGNVSPARMDFRWFLVGNCIAILSSLVTHTQATAIMDLIEERWEVLIGEMPLKITYPALEGHEWRTVTGFDPKNTRWSYHNGGSWPVLVWMLTAACIKTGRPQMAKRAIEEVEKRLGKDGWPEYYDGKEGRYVGKQARKYQTWSIAGYLVAKMMIENPANLLGISLEEDKTTSRPKHSRSLSF